MRALPALLLLSLALAGCTTPPAPPPPPPAPPPETGTPRPAAGFDPVVKLGTSRGDVFIEVFEEMVPLTAQNFLGYARSHFYEGVRFHRVIGPSKAPPDGFMVQAGDPNTRDPTKGRDTWGRGDPNLPKVPDEFTAALRHDAAGVVSMANAGPNTGTSQFFLTLAPAPWLDDKHAVFGKVVAGMEVVRAIGDVDTDGADRPVEDVVIERIQVLEAQRNATDVRRALDAWTSFPVLNGTANRTLQFGLVVRNAGNVRSEVHATLSTPHNWSWDNPFPGLPPAPTVSRVLPAQGSQVYAFHLVVPANASLDSDEPVQARFATEGAEATVNFTVHLGVLGGEAASGLNASVQYLGTLPDGRLFDSSWARLAGNASSPRVAGSQPRPGTADFPLRFRLDDPECGKPLQQRDPAAVCLVQGFTEGTRGLRVGEARTLVLPPEFAYGNAPCSPQQALCLSGRFLVFTIELLAVA
jgi:peptidyl-prolyl cis-trans isomerase A (cyclophilin A)